MQINQFESGGKCPHHPSSFYGGGPLVSKATKSEANYLTQQGENNE